MSWAFTVADERWEKQADGVYNRIITKFERLYDFSIVDQSYYGIENAVGCKRYAEILEEERAENERKLAELREQEEAEKEAKLADYYKNLHEEYDKIIKGE